MGRSPGGPEKQAEAKDGGAPPGPWGLLAPLEQFFPVKIKVDLLLKGNVQLFLTPERKKGKEEEAGREGEREGGRGEGGGTPRMAGFSLSDSACASCISTRA